jgi:hypothetical protein
MNGANGANEGINEPEKINIPENEPLNATKHPKESTSFSG